MTIESLASAIAAFRDNGDDKKSRDAAVAIAGFVMQVVEAVKRIEEKS